MPRHAYHAGHAHSGAFLRLAWTRTYIWVSPGLGLAYANKLPLQMLAQMTLFVFALVELWRF